MTSIEEDRSGELDARGNTAPQYIPLFENPTPSIQEALQQARDATDAAREARLDRIGDAVELAALQAGASRREAEIARESLYGIIQTTAEELTGA